MKKRFVFELKELRTREQTQLTNQCIISLLMGMKFFRVKVINNTLLVVILYSYNNYVNINIVCLSVSMSVCLSVSMSLCLSMFLDASYGGVPGVYSESVCLCLCFSVCLCLSVFLDASHGGVPGVYSVPT